MPVPWTIEKIEQEIKKAKNIADIANIFALVFGLSESRIEKEIADYERLEAMADAVQRTREPSSLDLFDVNTGYMQAYPDTKDAFISSAANKELLDKAKSVPDSNIKKSIEDIGRAFHKEHLHDIEKIISDIAVKKEELKNSRTRITNLRIEIEAWAKESYDKKIEQNKRYQELKKEYENLYSQWGNPRLGEISREQSAIRMLIRDELEKESEDRFPQYAYEIKNSQKVSDALEAYRDKLFRAVTDSLSTSSDISKEQAKEWVEGNIHIDDNAQKKLKRNKYPVEKLKEDIAELYRYIGGKLGPIDFSLTQGGRRAFAKGRSCISIQGDFTKKTLFHECGHLAEAWDRVFQVSCMEFVKNRATGSPVALKKMTGLGYQPHEKAYPDSFINPYVGKDYGGTASEVFSMALQCLASPEETAELIEKDQEHFHLLLGFCRRKNPLLEEQAQLALAQVQKRIQTQDRVKLWKKALEKVSGPSIGRKLTSDDGFHGYRISAWGRAGALLRNASRTDSISTWSSVHHGSVKDLRQLAYLLIAHDMRLLPEYYEDSRNAVYQLVQILFSDNVPKWFDPSMKLPEVK